MIWRLVISAGAVSMALSQSVAAQSVSSLRPLARPEVVIEAPMRPVAREIAALVVTLSISTMSTPVDHRTKSLAARAALGGEALEAVDRSLIRQPAQSVVLAVAPDVRPLVRPYRELDPVVVLDPTTTDVVLPSVAALEATQFSEFAVSVAYIPPERPEGITRAAEALEAERRRGSVCGDLAIQGVSRGNVPGPGACGIESGVEVRSVAGVRLSTPAVIDCTTATQLRRWVQDAAIPQFRDMGGGLASIEIMGAYSCRSRNNVAGARLSEHSFGRALDIGGFRMRDGTRVTVLNGWNSQVGQRLRALHSSACGPFGTVLGPNANAAHRDHFHFDTARYRSGSYCR